MKNIFYWSPHIDHVATVRAVINSAYSLVRYSKQKYIPYLINVAGEWDQYQDELSKKKINIINLTNSKILKKKVFKGFLKSRLIYIFIFIISIIPLFTLLKKEKPNYLIIHLLAPIPLLINYIFNFNTKCVLRISGKPQIDKNFIRRLIWKITLKKIFFITSPTNATKNYLIKRKIINKEKIYTLLDPVINLKEINKKKKEELDFAEKEFKNAYIAIGRITRQKNFFFLVNAFKEYNSGKSNKLVIIGDGEDYKKLNKKILDNNLQDQVFLIGYQSNIFKFLKNSKCFILTSLWEDPGWVLIEAGYLNSFVISSNCENGPIEILDNGKNGIIFESNNHNSLVSALNDFDKMTQQEKLYRKINLKKVTKNYTLFNHHKNLNFLLDKYE